MEAQHDWWFFPLLPLTPKIIPIIQIIPTENDPDMFYVNIGIFMVFLTDKGASIQHDELRRNPHP